MSNRHEMGRRQFLILSSACALATAAVGPKLFAGENASVPKSLAVGFAALEENAAVVDAASVPSADGGFIGRGARIGVSGASGASKDPIKRRAVELLAHFTYFEGAERRTTPFRAWSCSRLTGCQGTRLHFTVPVDDVQKLSFTVVAERGAPAGASTRRDALTAPTETIELPLSLSVTSEQGTLKLARGFYVIVPMFEGDSTPDWSRYAVRTLDGGRWSLVDADGNVAPFEHFVLRIDYATL